MIWPLVIYIQHQLLGSAHFLINHNSKCDRDLNQYTCRHYEQASSPKKI